MSADDELRRRRKRRALRVPVDEVPRRSAVSGFPPAPESTLSASRAAATSTAMSTDDVEELDAFEEITSELDLSSRAPVDRSASQEPEVRARDEAISPPSSVEELEVEPELAETLGAVSEHAAVEPPPSQDEPIRSEAPTESTVVVVRPMVRVSSMPPPPGDDFEASELADYWQEDSSGEDALPPLAEEPTRVEEAPSELEATPPEAMRSSEVATDSAERSDFSDPSDARSLDFASGSTGSPGLPGSPGSTDAGMSDSRSTDSRSPDSGSPDSGSPDSGSPSSSSDATDEAFDSRVTDPGSEASNEPKDEPSVVVSDEAARPNDPTTESESIRDSVEEIEGMLAESGETASLDELEPEDDAPELTIEDEDDHDLDGELDDVDEELDLEEHEAEEVAPKKAPAPPAAASTTQSAATPSAAAEAEPAKVEAPPRPEPKPRRRPWFETFFNDDYLRTVRPPKERDIERECDFITARLSLAPGATILDVGCGLGLHAIELTRRGYLVVGLDLSLPMLSRAGDEAQDHGLKINFLHGDMREMNFDGSFDAVLCWGTTFGYFDDDSNKRVVERLHRALKPRGVLLLDVVNRDHVIRSQPNLIWFEGDGCICMEESKFNYFLSRLEVKRTVMLDDGRQRDSVYTLRSYALHELGLLLHQQGFRVAEVSGMTATPGVFFGADSPRILVVAERRVDKKDDAASRPPPPGSPPDA